MTLGLCGRLRSGKSELANVCVALGYKKMSFADPLKQLCADLIGVSLEELNKMKNENTEISLMLEGETIRTLSEETHIPFSFVKEECDGRAIKTVRELLQFVGTDLIRKYNASWHVDKIYERISNYPSDTNYVFDDVRFKNEKQFIEKRLGGDCWYVVRPTLENVSNHPSETSIRWDDCWNRVIINDSTIESLKVRWHDFVKDYKDSMRSRDKLFNELLENGQGSGIKDMSVADMLMLHRSMFDVTPIYITKDEIKSMQILDNKSLLLKMNDGTCKMIENRLMIEDLKRFI